MRLPPTFGERRKGRRTDKTTHSRAIYVEEEDRRIGDDNLFSFSSFYVVLN